ncbi:Sir2 family NAD-dependent protein deacetylase [Saccharothrix longispora]|uniref:SIR2 family NAD-dependent protein deacylase n=1 Tax=Saccharothrix longispora TaxID=33920 RepID=UPI0028FD9218|nr:Sir2 family NAD-dependent protein deacetylase [Saccharothrix longispora]MBY8848819.1 Sir2 family NAD-dependent protein deacetylase [Saccharothrix sp. MB29]MDU0290519.1 Sir2 family NAD-dependent protein deacetylase [Saccharothrix longispora]
MGARDVMAVARRITVLTGAGVSFPSGVARFAFAASPYLASAAARRSAWRSWLDDPMWSAEPNAAHTALAELERAGRVRSLLTQNVDGLHQRAGSTAVVELHGSMARVVCASCGAAAPVADALAQVRAGAPYPVCADCGGVRRPAVVAFGEPVPEPVLREARTAVLDCDALLAVGTSLTVSPASDLVGLAVRAGAAVVVVNPGPTPYDGVAAAVVRAPAEEALPELVAVPVTASGPVRTWGDPSSW